MKPQCALVTDQELGGSSWKHEKQSYESESQTDLVLLTVRKAIASPAKGLASLGIVAHPCAYEIILEHIETIETALMILCWADGIFSDDWMILRGQVCG